MPNGAILSPPDSSGSSDDDETSGNKRGRQLVNLAELQEAVRRSIGVRKDGSPTRMEDLNKVLSRLSLVVPNDSSGLTEQPEASTLSQRQQSGLSPEARRISHSRSTSDNAFLSPRGQSADVSPIATSDDSDEDDEGKPPLLRKKSGELVKPALRASSRRRYSSMPGTPTYSKNVHFNEDICQVRHFLQVDKPLAVSAGSSPVETYDSESEYPFSNEDGSSSPKSDWDIKLANFPAESYARSTLPVRVERIFLSSDQRTLVGTVGVANLAFHKLVVARFTFDYWKTTSEVVAEYDNDFKKSQVNDGCDRFKFSIKLNDQTNLESKTLLLCIRYSVAGQEYWDNNDDMNFQIDFAKKPKHDSPKGAASSLAQRPLASIPRSRHHPPTSSRPRSMPPSLDDDFATMFNDSKYRFGSSDFSDTPGGSIKLKRKSQRPIVSTSQEGKGGNSAFAARYDFGSSLSAALNNAQLAMGDRSGLKSKATTKLNNGYFGNQGSSSPPKQDAQAPRPDTISSEKPSQNSIEYHELIQKYCFFGSAKSSPPTAPNAKAGQQSDSPKDDESVSDYNLRDSGSNSPQMSRERPSYFDGANDRRASGNQHGAATVMARSASPVPLNGHRATSPTSFGYPYHSGGMFNESHAPQAIGV
ncbi:MAG: hypothetical protein M1820_009969 [Bogoriella megaspora]|nr:MAG: hypothetical protein M1820_009969 [Bogoriella megaspora]